MVRRNLQVLAIGTILVAVIAPVTGAEPIRLAVRLNIDQDGGLSAAQLRLAIEEVGEIWKDVGVAVASGQYGDSLRSGEATISLRILRARAPNGDGAERVVLAWVTAIESGRSAPLLFVSLPAVTEAVMRADALGRPVTQLTRALQERLIARAVGRVTAHELGHYLLQNAAHGDRGLMRANYSSSELVGQWSDPFKVPTAERPVFRQEVASLARVQRPF
jgi:hypothetical protein